VVTEAEFRALKEVWQSNAVLRFLVSHAPCACVDAFEGGGAGVLAWFDNGALHLWCRYDGQKLEATDVAWDGSQQLAAVISAGLGTEYPRILLNDMSGKTFSQCVDRLLVVLRRAALLSTDGGSVH